MYCSNCGKEIKEKDRYCGSCGKSVIKSSDEITFYNNPNNEWNRSYTYAQRDTDDGKAVGVICALFVPLLISIFIGLIYKDPVARSNYYKYFGITYLILIGIVFVAFVIFIVIAVSSPDYEAVNTVLNLIFLKG